jgi:hypothetical protein
VRIIPGNQTLILANEGAHSGGLPTTAIARALRGSSDESVLQRVTVFAARPDSTLLYFRADYSAGFDSAPHPGPSTSSAAINLPATLPVSGLPATQAPRRNSYSSSRGIELYASTQQILTDSPPAHIDVRA